MTKPQAGDSYELTGETIGNPPNEVKTGTVVTVREVVAADEAGAHDDTEDAVVVEYEVPTLGVDGDGEPAVIQTARAFSVGVSQFGELFTKAV